MIGLAPYTNLQVTGGGFCTSCQSGVSYEWPMGFNVCVSVCYIDIQRDVATKYNFFLRVSHLGNSCGTFSSQGFYTFEVIDFTLQVDSRI